MPHEYPRNAFGKTPERRVAVSLESRIKKEDIIERPIGFQNLNDVNEFLKNNYDSPLFIVKTYRQIEPGSEGNGLAIQLPLEISDQRYLDDDERTCSITQYAQYWSIKEDNRFEMVLMPEFTHSRLSDEAIYFLKSRYPNQAMQKYDTNLRGIGLPSIEGMEGKFVELKASHEPIITIKLTPKPVEEKYLQRYMEEEVIEKDIAPKISVIVPTPIMSSNTEVNEVKK